MSDQEALRKLREDERFERTGLRVEEAMTLEDQPSRPVSGGAVTCNCRYPGSLGGDCDGSCQHPEPLIEVLVRSLKEMLGDEAEWFQEHPDDYAKRLGDSLGKDIYRSRWMKRERARNALALAAAGPAVSPHEPGIAVLRADIADALDWLESSATIKNNAFNVPEINAHNEMAKAQTERIRLAIFSRPTTTPPAPAADGTVKVSEEALRNCGCPSDRRGTVGDCQDSGQCGCSLPRAQRGAE